jgi:hypothetical protein
MDDYQKPIVKSTQIIFNNNETGEEYSSWDDWHNDAMSNPEVFTGGVSLTTPNEIYDALIDAGAEDAADAVSDTFESSQWRKTISDDDMWELEQLLSEYQVAAGNTYNENWFGPVYNYTMLSGGSDWTYGPSVSFVRVHNSGDVRGNYGKSVASFHDAVAEEFPQYVYSMIILIKTDKGTDRFGDSGGEGFTFECWDSETEVFFEGDEANGEEIAAAYDFSQVSNDPVSDHFNI